MTRSIYNAAINCIEFCKRPINGIFKLLPGNNKLRKFAEGQQGLLDFIGKRTKTDKPVIWIHAASLGEFAVARPMIKELNSNGHYSIILTFFSSTGYEALKENHPGIDHVFYLPLDTKKNAVRFLDMIKPEKAVFIISEIWLNYLDELKKRGIPTFLVSAIIHPKAIFFKWYGKDFRRALNSFTNIITTDRNTVESLEKLDYKNTRLTNNPLFDNAATVADTDWKDTVIESFAKDREVFIAGSMSDIKDMGLVTHLANNNKDIRFIMVPHEIDKDYIDAIRNKTEGNTVLYSECGPETDLSDKQVLIIDFVGALAYLYRYGKWAYIGGGFTPMLHSIIEATVYGLPASFGPETDKTPIAKELVNLDLGTIVRSENDLEAWFSSLKNDPDKLHGIRDKALEYIRSNRGGTSAVISILEQKNEK